MPPQDGATGELAKDRSFGASLECKKAVNGFFHEDVDDRIVIDVPW